jgi:hypothetical protein
MNKPTLPHEIAKHFFQSLIQNQLQVCWGLFSKRSQNTFINWTLNDLYTQSPNAAKAAELGPPEIKLMFETNTVDLVIRFWRRFVRESRAVQYARYAYFTTTETQGKTAIVEARFNYENGQEHRVNLTMVHEAGSWKLGYLESGLNF